MDGAQELKKWLLLNSKPLRNIVVNSRLGAEEEQEHREIVQGVVEDGVFIAQYPRVSFKNKKQPPPPPRHILFVSDHLKLWNRLAASPPHTLGKYAVLFEIALLFVFDRRTANFLAAGMIENLIVQVIIMLREPTMINIMSMSTGLFVWFLFFAFYKSCVLAYKSTASSSLFEASVGKVSLSVSSSFFSDSLNNVSPPLSYRHQFDGKIPYCTLCGLFFDQLWTEVKSSVGGQDATSRSNENGSSSSADTTASASAAKIYDIESNNLTQGKDCFYGDDNGQKSIRMQMLPLGVDGNKSSSSSSSSTVSIISSSIKTEHIVNAESALFAGGSPNNLVDSHSKRSRGDKREEKESGDNDQEEEEDNDDEIQSPRDCLLNSSTTSQCQYYLLLNVGTKFLEGYTATTNPIDIGAFANKMMIFLCVYLSIFAIFTVYFGFEVGGCVLAGGRAHYDPSEHDDPFDCTTQYIFSIGTVFFVIPATFNFIASLGLCMGIVGLWHGARVMHCLASSWVERFAPLRLVTAAAADDEKIHVTPLGNIVGGNDLNLSTLINSYNNNSNNNNNNKSFAHVHIPGTGHVNLTAVVKRDALEHYLFLREFATQVSSLWSNIILFICAGAISFSVVTFYELVVVKNYGLVFDFLWIIPGALLIILGFFATYCFAHANSAVDKITHVFKHASAGEDDFHILGGRELWLQHLQSSPAHWTIHGFAVTWYSLAAFASSVGTLAIGVVASFVYSAL